jgi:hypothetical protein
MIKFDKPINLNGSELLNELKAGGVAVNQNTSPMIDGNNDFWLDIEAADKTKADAIVAAHNGTTVAIDNSAAKAALLARLGITADEAKLLLA